MIDHNPEELSPSLWVEIVIFISSYYPLFLILLIRDISNKKEGIPFGIPSWELHVSVYAIAFFFASSIATLISARLLTSLLKHQEGGTPIKIIESDQVRGDMLNYTLPFLIGLFAFDYDTPQSTLSLLIFLFFIFSFIQKEQISLLNPMFLLIGIRLYRLKFKEIGRSEEKNNKAICLGKITPSNTTVEIKETAGINFVFPAKRENKDGKL